ncbi:unnamed protein product [Rhodiola kirilowii]
MDAIAGDVEAPRKPVFRDIRRYYCEYCGLCRSKKSLIASHIRSHHQNEMDEGDDVKEGSDEDCSKCSNTCDECGASFKKPSHLKQHMLTHSGEKSFVCPVDDCHSSYKRKDHLNRHILQHQGKLFKCPIETCGKEFTIQGNMTRHVKEMHDGEEPPSNVGEKLYICQEAGCGKTFKYASKLKKHEDSHVKLVSSEVLCLEPGCLQYFSNEECLKEHIRSCHQHVTCEVCGTKQLRKNFKRHLRAHDDECSSERVKCEFDGCGHTFSTRSNLQQHVKAVHLVIRPFACRFPDCGMTFAFKHVRDNHEKTSQHTYIEGDFVEADEQFRARPRGGRKRQCPTIEVLLRKRVRLPAEEFNYNAWRDSID